MARRRLVYLLAIAAVASCALAPAASAFGPLASIGSRGEGAGQFANVTGLAVAADGRLYVTDGEDGSNRIDVFDPHGAFLFAFGNEVAPGGADICTTASGCKAGVANGTAGALRSPAGLLIGPDGRLYVADAENRRIDVFDSNGTFLFAFGREVNANGSDICAAGSTCQAGTSGPARSDAGGMDLPLSLGLDGAGNLYVADEQNGRVDVFTQGGTFLRAFGGSVNPQPNPANPNVCTAASGCKAGRRTGEAGELQSPEDVEVAPSGQIVVSDFQNRRINVFSDQDEFLYAFGDKVSASPSGNPDVCTFETGCQQGSDLPLDPRGIAIDSRNQIYVADQDASRIDEFGIDGHFIRAFGAGVVGGGEAFEICTLGCRKGTETAAPAGISFPWAVALDGAGGFYTSSEGSDPQETMFYAHIERFGDALPPSPPLGSRPSNKFRFGSLKLHRKSGTAALTVVVPGPGALALAGKGLKPARATAKRAGNVVISIKPTAKSRRKLVKGGLLRVRATVTFTPTGGSAATQTRALQLRHKR